MRISEELGLSIAQTDYDHDDWSLVSLLEDVGNLRALQPNIISALKRNNAFYSITKTNRFGRAISSNGKHRIGRNSEVKTWVNNFTAKDALKLLTDDKATAVVIQFGPKQVFYGTAVENINYGAYFDSMRNMPGIAEEDVRDLYELNRSSSKTNFVKIVNRLIALSDVAEMNISLIAVYPDAEREKTSLERRAARKDMVPRELGIRDFRNKERERRAGINVLTEPWFDKTAGQYSTDKILYALRDRLDKFKKSRSITVENPEEMLKLLTERGFFKNITVGGYVYELLRTNGRADDLLPLRDDPSSRSHRSEFYFEYRLSDRSAVEKKMESEFLEKNPEYRDPERRGEFYKAVYEYCKEFGPPGKIEVHYGAVGGVLSPTLVKTKSMGDL